MLRGERVRRFGEPDEVCRDRQVLDEYGLSVPFVGPDNFHGAELVGRYLAGKLANAAEVALIEGVPTAFNSRQRSGGFRKAMSDADSDDGSEPDKLKEPDAEFSEQHADNQTDRNQTS